MKTKHRRRQKKLLSNNLVRNIVAGVVLIALSIAIFFGFVSFTKNPPAPKYIGPIQHISTSNVVEYSALSIIAKERGFFRDNGLEVTMQNATSGPAAVADLLAGKVDTATAADFVGVSNSFHNEDLRILITQSKTNSFFMVARQDHGIKTPADLKAKRIGVTNKTAGEFFLGQYLNLNKLSRQQISVVYGAPAELVSMLVEGKIDAAVSFDPHIRQAKNNLKDNAVVWSVQGDQKLSSLLYGTKKLVRERPEATRRYISALVEAEEFIQNNDNEARDIVAKHLGYSDEQIKHVWGNITFDVSLDQDLLISMEDQALWAIENKLTDATKIPDYLHFIYFEGLETVQPDEITIIR